MFDHKAYMKKYYQEHKKEHDKTSKEWAEKHPEYQKKHYLQNRGKIINQNCEYQKKNLEKIQDNHRKLHHKRRMKAFELLGGKCTNPYNLNHGDFIQDIRCLQIDHINGGGREHFGKRQTYGLITDVLKDPNRMNKYQLLCANCNWIKRYKMKEHGGHPKNL